MRTHYTIITMAAGLALVLSACTKSYEDKPLGQQTTLEYVFSDIDSAGKAAKKYQLNFFLQALDIKVGALVLPSESYTHWRLALDHVTDDVRWVLGFLELPPACRVEMIGSFWEGARSPRRALQALSRWPATTRAILGARKRWTRAWA